MFLLLALLLFLLLPSPWNVIGGLAALVPAVFEVVYWQRRARRGKVQTGVENLVGATGEVTERLAPSGRIRVLGELWKAHRAPSFPQEHAFASSPCTGSSWRSRPSTSRRADSEMLRAGRSPNADRASGPCRPRRVISRLIGVVSAAGSRYFAAGCPQHAAGIAYRVLFSLAPLAIVLVSVFGLVLQDDELREQFVDRVLDALPRRRDGE